MSQFVLPSVPVRYTTNLSGIQPEYVHVQSSSSPAVSSQSTMSSTTHLRGSRRTKRGKSDKDSSVGNDGVAPWIKSIPREQIFKISQYLDPAAFLSTSTTVPTFAGTTFTVAGLDNFASLSAVFDQYRIDLIEVLLVPKISEVLGSSTSVGTFVSAVDLDDGNVPTVFGQVASYNGAIMTNGTQSHYHRWKPMFAVAAYSGAFTSYAESGGWVDCASSSVQYYGIKAANTVAGQAQGIDILTRIHMSFRAIH